MKYLLHDSRQLQSASETLFFAIETDKNDGHEYISELYQKGVRNFIIEKEINTSKYPDATFELVNNSVHKLQEIAKEHRQQFNIPVIGITGSNGKTIVKEWLYHLLHEKEEIARSPQSYNSQIGVPLSVWEIQKEHTLGIFEAGVSRHGEMQNLKEIIACNYGIFTSLGTAHAAGFQGDEEKVKEKSILFGNCEKVFYKSDIPYLKKYISNGISFGNKKTDTLQILAIKNIKEKNLQTEIKAIYKKEEVIIKIPFSDSASCDNALLCCLVCLEMDYDKNYILNQLKMLPSVAMRLELKKGINNTVIINDTYNSDITSLQSSLSFLDNQAGNKKGILILSDILEDARNKKELYQKVAELIQKHPRLNKIIGIGESIEILKELLPQEFNVEHYPSTEIFLFEVKDQDFNQEIILVKGAREFRFERIV
ncbi:MAG: Mur ligase family protein, partial [Saprospiraceae bacterium]